MVVHTRGKNRECFTVMNLISQKCENFKQYRWEVFLFSFTWWMFFQSRGNKIRYSLFWFNEFCLFDVDEFRMKLIPDEKIEN